MSERESGRPGAILTHLGLDLRLSLLQQLGHHHGPVSARPLADHSPLTQQSDHCIIVWSNLLPKQHTGTRFTELFTHTGTRSIESTSIFLKARKHLKSRKQTKNKKQINIDSFSEHV